MKHATTVRGADILNNKYSEKYTNSLTDLQRPSACLSVRRYMVNDDV